MAELNTKEELFGVITTNETIEGNINPSGKIVASMIAPKGAKGDPGEDGITPTIGENGNWYLDEIDTGKPSRGLPGEKGETGSTGNGIESITLSSTSGKIKTYTILFTNGTTTTFNVSDGEDGLIGHDGKGLEFNWNGTQLGVRVEGTSEYTYVDLKGSKGDPGEAGQDGVSPTVTTSKSGKVTTITITDKQGIHTATILDGSDGSGSGDMLKSTYDTNENGIVDNAEKVNNHTVNADVPSNAVFTDTTYTAGTGIDITNGVISNTQTSANWGNITGTLSNQTDLQNALNNKQNTISDLDTIRSGASLGATALQSYTETDPVFSASVASGITSTDITNWNNKSTFSGNYNDLSNKPSIPTKTSDLTNDSNYITNTYHDSSKQDKLVSGTNIKTINSQSILGNGNIEIESGISNLIIEPYESGRSYDEGSIVLKDGVVYQAQDYVRWDEEFSTDKWLDVYSLSSVVSELSRNVMYSPKQNGTVFEGDGETTEFPFVYSWSITYGNPNVTVWYAENEDSPYEQVIVNVQLSTFEGGSVVTVITDDPLPVGSFLDVEVTYI